MRPSNEDDHSIRHWGNWRRQPMGSGEARPDIVARDSGIRRGLDGQLNPLAAVRLLWSLPPRYEALFAHASHEALIRRPDSSPWSVLERTTHVRDLLVAVDAQLRHLNGEEVQPPAHVEAPRAGANASSCQGVLASLTTATARLVRTVNATTALDSATTRTDDGTTVPELVGRALHEALRHAHEAEATLGADTANGRAPA